MGPRQLSQASWGMASLGHIPSSLWLDAFLTRTHSCFSKVFQFVTFEIMKHSCILDACILQTYRVFRPFSQASASDLSRLTWSMARFDRMSQSDPQWEQDRFKGWARGAGQGALVSEDWALACWEAVHSLVLKHHDPSCLETEIHNPPLEKSRPVISPGQVAVVMCALNQTGHAPPLEVFSDLLAFLGPRSATMTPTQDCQVRLYARRVMFPSCVVIDNRIK